jgi:hypothetical protein
MQIGNFELFDICINAYALFRVTNGDPCSILFGKKTFVKPFISVISINFIFTFSEKNDYKNVF